MQSMGILNKDEKTVTCPLHLSAFTLEKRIPLNPPAEESFKPYEVFIKPEDGRVSISLPAESLYHYLRIECFQTLPT
jgi:nitrite reductase/ring-hydroxylating ferredoxin subunit